MATVGAKCCAGLCVSAFARAKVTWDLVAVRQYLFFTVFVFLLFWSFVMFLYSVLCLVQQSTQFRCQSTEAFVRESSFQVARLSSGFQQDS